MFLVLLLEMSSKKLHFESAKLLKELEIFAELMPEVTCHRNRHKVQMQDRHVEHVEQPIVEASSALVVAQRTN